MRKLRSVLGHWLVLFEQKTAINSRLLRLRKIFVLILVKQLKTSFHVLSTKTNLIRNEYLRTRAARITRELKYPPALGQRLIINFSQRFRENVREKS